MHIFSERNIIIYGKKCNWNIKEIFQWDYDWPGDRFALLLLQDGDSISGEWGHGELVQYNSN